MCVCSCVYPNYINRSVPKSSRHDQGKKRLVFAKILLTKLNRDYFITSN